MRRRVGRAVFILFCGALATVLGTVSALLWTGPGRRLLARVVVEETRGLVRGTVAIGAVSGRFTTGFTLERVTIRDTAGAVFAEVPRLDVAYRLGNLVAGRVVFASLDLSRPRFHIVKRRSTGRFNWQEIFRLGEGKGGGPSPLIEVHDLHVDSGHVTLVLPWNPDGRLRTERQRDSALDAERAKPGRRIEAGPEGLDLVRTIENLNTDISLLRLSSPDDQPVVVEIAGLEARISDPMLEVRDLRGTLRTKNDSLVFDLPRVELPGTEGTASGRIDWPQDTIRYRFEFDAPKLALADVRFVSPDFPSFAGKAKVRATSVSNQRVDWAITDLAVGDSAGAIEGSLVAITDVYRGLGFRDLRVVLSNLDLDVPRPYLDTLPFHGRVSGRLEADGFFDAMTVDLDWVFEDASVTGGATNLLVLAGLLHLGGPEGMRFSGATLRDTEFDLRTVRLVAPAVSLEGRLGLNGTLTGPWKNVVFEGTAIHQDEQRPVSRATGTVRLDTRGTALALDADLQLDSLSFEGIRRGFPDLKAQGSIAGRVKLAGRLDSLHVEGAVGGAIGEVEARGLASLGSSRFGADSLLLRFRGLDLARLRGSGARTSLQGRVLATGSVDSAEARGRLDLALGRGTIRELTFDSLVARLRGVEGFVRVDTAALQWEGGRIDARGAIGWRAPHADTIRIHADFQDLVVFDSLVRTLAGMGPDTTEGGEERLRGQGTAEIFVSGAVDTFELDAKAVIGRARFAGIRAWNINGEGSWSTVGPHFTAKVQADSLARGSLGLIDLQAEAYGRPDSLQWSGTTEGRRFARLAGAGAFRRVGPESELRVDSLGLDLLGRGWRLQRPAVAWITDAAIRLDTVRFLTAEGSGSVTLVGDLPSRSPGELTVTALGIRLEDLYGLAQRDTTEIDGTLTLDLRVAGTADAPELRGLATVTGPVFRDFRAPLMRAGLDYRARRLRSDITFWRTGRPVVDVSAELPIDLAFHRVARRQLPGQISIIAKGDSVDLALVEAFTPNLRRVTGRLNMDARVEGTWEAPRLAGSVELIDGAATMPGLGVRYSAIYGTLRLSGDSILTESLSLETDPGTLTVSGGLRLPGLTRPVFDLTMDAREFRLIDVENYLSITAWGTVRLSGTVFRPVLTGEGSIANSTIYFADLITKDVINLEDPRLADLVDTLALRRLDLRAPFQSRFLDSLTIRNLELRLGQSVWLRSTEANIQLEGNRIRINKTRDNYVIEGDLDAPRGTYTLKLPGIVRTFVVEGGSVRYFGDLNAQVDIRARHEVRTPGATGDVAIIAHITGTLLAPNLTLRAPERPALSEEAIISLLALGTADPQGGLRGGEAAGIAAAVAAYASSVLASEIAASGQGRTADIIEIRPPLASSGLYGGQQALQLSVGRAVTEKLFLIANAGFCVGRGQQSLNARNLGASLEYRFRRELRALVAAEPVVSCFGQGADLYGPPRRYQFGAELRWDREY